MGKQVFTSPESCVHFKLFYNIYVAGTTAKMYVMEFILRPTLQNPQLRTGFLKKNLLTFHVLNCTIAAYSDQRDDQKLMWV